MFGLQALTIDSNHCQDVQVKWMSFLVLTWRHFEFIFILQYFVCYPLLLKGQFNKLLLAFRSFLLLMFIDSNYGFFDLPLNLTHFLFDKVNHLLWFRHLRFSLDWQILIIRRSYYLHLKNRLIFDRCLPIVLHSYWHHIMLIHFCFRNQFYWFWLIFWIVLHLILHHHM